MCKGVLLLSGRTFVETRFGAAGWQKCLAAFDADERVTWGAVVAVRRYPIGMLTRLLRVADREHAKGDLALCVDAGRFAAEFQLTMFHKFILRFTTPHWLMDRGVRIYDENVGSGKWTIERVSDRQLTARLSGFAEPDAVLCRRHVGWIQRAAEMTGAKECVVEETRCRTLGHPLCEFKGGWRT